MSDIVNTKNKSYIKIGNSCVLNKEQWTEFDYSINLLVNTIPQSDNEKRLLAIISELICIKKENNKLNDSITRTAERLNRLEDKLDLDIDNKKTTDFGTYLSYVTSFIATLAIILVIVLKAKGLI